jgi:hypothetical protein
VSDPNHVRYARVRSNYVVNWGNTGYGQRDQASAAFGGAPFTFLRGVPMAAIRDGGSNTLMLSEVLTPQSPGYTGPLGDPMISEAGATFDSWLTPNSTARDVVDRMCPPDGDGGEYCQVDGDGVPNRNVSEVPPDQHVAARSYHSGGVLATLCDGSTRFFSNHIDLQTWRALSTTKGGEPIDAAKY